ncbi:MAG: GntR family transcriptional regulator [Pseudomonadota bacterium]
MAQTSKERLYHDLQRRILTLDLAPGTHLDETRLSEEYGISRTPLRDVFRQLDGEGYIQIREHRGTVVSPMGHKTMRDFFLAAPMIYSAVARLAARNARERDVAELAAVQARFRAAVESGDVDGMVYWNDRFHLAIGEIADNPYLMPSLRRLLIDHARIGQTFWRAAPREETARIDTASRHHDAFLEAFAAHDEEAAVRLVREHWELSRSHIERYVRPDPLPEDLPMGA